MSYSFEGMGNGEWGMGNGEWGLGTGDWGLKSIVLNFYLKQLYFTLEL
ncbi:MAG: hypothetical protein AAFY16_02195 [Cyanobacteria bacterium J06642_3]